MPISTLVSASTSESSYSRRRAARIAFHAFLKRVLRRQGHREYLLQKDDIGIRLADGHGRIDEIDMLVTRMYRQRGYLIPASSSAEQQVIRRVTLEACHDNQTVGTVTVNLDSRDGLHAEDLYAEEIARYRAHGARVCEFNRLALDIEACSRNALACLFHLAFIFAYHIYGATDLFIEVNPRHVLFYRRKLGFEVAGAEKLCRRVNAPAVLLHRELQDLAEQVMRWGGLRVPENKSFLALWLPPWEEKELIATIRRMLAETA